MRISPWLKAAVLALVAAGSGLAQNNSAVEHFTLQKQTEIPGATLKPGDYTLSVVDSLTDRTVLQLDGSGEKAHRLLLAVSSTLAGTSGQPLFWDARTQGKPVLRGFVFANGRSVEFVYPKNDAVALAKANHSSVVAVDPPSEGRPELKRLSSNDMQMVNLWLLTPTRVGSEQAMAAKRYEPEASVAQGTSSSSGNTSQPAGASAPTNSVRNTVPVGGQHSTSIAASQSRTLVARADTRPHRLQKLPQTGSNLPWFWLVGSTSLFCAALLRARRFVVQTA